jgi:hypothetical protein
MDCTNTNESLENSPNQSELLCPHGIDRFSDVCEDCFLARCFEQFKDQMIEEIPF